MQESHPIPFLPFGIHAPKSLACDPIQKIVARPRRHARRRRELCGIVGGAKLVEPRISLAALDVVEGPLGMAQLWIDAAILLRRNHNVAPTVECCMYLWFNCVYNGLIASMAKTQPKGAEHLAQANTGRCPERNRRSCAGPPGGRRSDRNCGRVEIGSAEKDPAIQAQVPRGRRTARKGGG